MPTIVCVNQGNYCGMGRQYVHRLYDMVRRNTTKDFSFICFTDDKEPYEDPIKKRPLPKEAIGWFAKLYLFSELDNAFYFDLDTLITSNIDDILEYDGPLAMLRDFYRPNGYGSGLMSWRGDYSDIWDEYEKEGYPDIIGGDQAWIEKYAVRPPVVLQFCYKGIYSYKQDCERWPPADAKIICFHGEPKPHEFTDSWINLIWRIGGASNIDKPAPCATVSNGQQLKNIEENCKLELPWLSPYAENPKTLCIVGGSPSLKDNLGKLREKIRLGAKVMSLNGSLNFLISKGITPDYHAQFDSRPECGEFVKEPPNIKYFIGSMSDPSIFDVLRGKDVILWHGGVDLDETLKILKSYQHKPIVVVGGGETIGLRAMKLGYHMGFRKLSIFGMDSSFQDNQHHTYSQPLNDLDGKIDIWHDGKKYQCSWWMYRQAKQFEELYHHLTKEGVNITVIGEGLIPDIYRCFNGKRTT